MHSRKSALFLNHPTLEPLALIIWSQTQLSMKVFLDFALPLLLLVPIGAMINWHVEEEEGDQNVRRSSNLWNIQSMIVRKALRTAERFLHI